MTDRCLECVELLRLAAGKLRDAATEGPPRSVWASELRVTARCIETIAKKIGEWVGR